MSILVGAHAERFKIYLFSRFEGWGKMNLSYETHYGILG